MKINEIVGKEVERKIYNKVKKDKSKKEKLSEKDILELMGHSYHRRGPHGAIRQVK